MDTPTTHQDAPGTTFISNQGEGDAPTATRGERKELVDLMKARLDLKKITLRGLSRTTANKEKREQLKGEIDRMEEDLRFAEQYLRELPPDPIVDEDQPWYGRVYANCRNFYVKMDDDTYKELSVEAASGFLKEWGISDRPDTTGTSSPLIRTRNAIHNRHSVDWAGALAGYRPGVQTLPNGKKILITKGPTLMKPVEGEFPTIVRFLEGMLRDQLVYFHGWMQHAVQNLYAGKIKKGQSTVFAGPINSGKSVLQNLIISPLLGGRVAKPYAFLAGRTDFNGDWFECEHLMCEDETPPRDYETQQLIAAGLKSLSANDDQWCHDKGIKALTLSPFWRVSMSVNDSPEALRVVPVNDPTLKDKMNVLKTYPDSTVALVKSLGGQEAFAAAIKEELPAYLHHLLEVFELPEALKDTRFGMKAYQNPEIIEAVEETAPHIHLLDALRKKVYPGSKNLKKSVAEVFHDLHESGVPRGITPANPNTLGKYLASIADMATGEVVRKRTDGERFYVLNFKKTP